MKAKLNLAQARLPGSAISKLRRVLLRFSRSADSLVREFFSQGELRADKAVRAPLVAALPCYALALGLGSVFGQTAATFSDANWTTPGSGMSGPVYALAVSGSDVYAGGGFKTADGSIVNFIAKWDGDNWSALGSGMNNAVFALAVSGNDLYAGGQFTRATNSGGVTVTANYVAKWDGSNWTALGSGIGSGSPAVIALAVSGSDLYAGGIFSTAGGNAASSIAKWDGNSWSALGSGIVGSVHALAVSGRNVYAGGSIIRAGGSVVTNIAKWDGSGGWSALGAGLDGPGPVNALVVSGGDLYAGGGFTTAGGSAANRVAKWDGNSWSPLGSGINSVLFALAVSGADVYVGGQFTTAGGGVANRVAKWDGSSWSALGLGINASVWALAVSDSDLYVGGTFTTAGGKVSTNIARAYLPTLPTLSVFRSGSDVMVSWPSVETSGFTLEQADTLDPPGSWVPDGVSITDNGTNKFVNVPATNRAQFFRLRRP